MNTSTQFPNDENGDVLRRMLKGGDDLSQPRVIDFTHIFPERRQALVFAEMIDDRESQVCISYNEVREMWDATVKRYMIPTHQDISALELSLASRAESVGGKADGWGCMLVDKKE